MKLLAVKACEQFFWNLEGKYLKEYDPTPEQWDLIEFCNDAQGLLFDFLTKDSLDIGMPKRNVFHLFEDDARKRMCFGG